MKRLIIIAVLLLAGFAQAEPVDVVFVPATVFELPQVQNNLDKFASWIFTGAEAGAESKNTGWVSCTLGGTNGYVWVTTQIQSSDRLTPEKVTYWTDKVAGLGVSIWRRIAVYSASGIVLDGEVEP